MYEIRGMYTQGANPMLVRCARFTFHLWVVTVLLLG